MNRTVDQLLKEIEDKLKSMPKSAHRLSRVYILLRLCKKQREALIANHKWHQEYGDDHGEYDGSELCDLNVSALNFDLSEDAAEEKAKNKI